MSIFFPVSTTTLNNFPTVNITVDNQSTLNIVTLDVNGFVGKTPLSALKSFLQPTSLSAFTDIVTENKLLGRYSIGDGEIEEISLGTGLEIDSNGFLNCTLEISGTAGGDFEGTYPNPTIRDNSVSLQKFVGLSSNKLLGRYSPGTGSLEEISLSSDFEISNGELSLLNVANISATGFIISQVSDDFIAEKTHLYFVNSPNINVTATVATSNLGDQIIFINVGNSILTIEFPNETVITTDNFNYFVSDGEDNFYKL